MTWLGRVTSWPRLGARCPPSRSITLLISRTRGKKIGWKRWSWKETAKEYGVHCSRKEESLGALCFLGRETGADQACSFSEKKQPVEETVGEMLPRSTSNKHIVCPWACNSTQCVLEPLCLLACFWRASLSQEAVLHLRGTTLPLHVFLGTLAGRPSAPAAGCVCCQEAPSLPPQALAPGAEHPPQPGVLPVAQRLWL